jgi:hypothetical protein
MSPRLFRFGVVAISAAGGKEWTATAQWAEDAGFSALLVPDLPPRYPRVSPFSIRPSWSK